MQVLNLASSYIDARLQPKNNQRKRFADFDRDSVSSSSSFTPSLWWNEGRVSSLCDEYISAREAYTRLNMLLSDGVNCSFQFLNFFF